MIGQNPITIDDEGTQMLIGKNEDGSQKRIDEKAKDLERLSLRKYWILVKI